MARNRPYNKVRFVDRCSTGGRLEWFGTEGWMQSRLNVEICAAIILKLAHKSTEHPSFWGSGRIGIVRSYYSRGEEALHPALSWI